MSDEQLSTEEIDSLLSAAIAAPSMHNTQPWRFEVNGHVIDVFLDGSAHVARRGPDRPGDADRRRCSDLQPALRGRRTRDTAPGSAWRRTPKNPTCWPASSSNPPSTPDERAARPRRRRSRAGTPTVRPSDATPLAEDIRVDLVQAAFAEGAELTWLGEPEVHTVLDMVLDTDLREIGDWHRRAERAHWVGGDRTTEGVPSSALGPRSTSYPGGRPRPGHQPGRPDASAAPRSRRTRTSPYCPPTTTNPPIRSPPASRSNGSC